MRVSTAPRLQRWEIAHPHDDLVVHGAGDEALAVGQPAGRADHVLVRRGNVVTLSGLWSQAHKAEGDDAAVR